MGRVERKADVVQDFMTRFGREPQIVVRAPGRVNLLGEHVDYNEGWVLPAATEHAVWLAAARGKDDLVHIRAMDFDQTEVMLSLAGLHERDQEQPVTWTDYPRGVAWVLRSAGYDVPPIDAVFTGDVPIGAGVSSSAAVEVAFLAAWNHLGDLNLSPLQLAQLGQKTENQYIGLASGIMDQFASVHGADGRLILLDCRTLEYELVPLPTDYAILVADSGVRRALAGSEYNVRRNQCEEAVAILQSYLPGIRTLRDVSRQDFERLAHHLPAVVRRRAQHVVEECERVLQGAELLRCGEIDAFGRLIRQSHASLRDLYEVSIPELDVLAATAWQVPGCYGARLTGAGFGGCVIALAEVGAVEAISASMREQYERAFSRTPAIFTTTPADGVRLLEP